MPTGLPGAALTGLRPVLWVADAPDWRCLQVFLGYGDRLTPMGIYYRADVDIEF